MDTYNLNPNTYNRLYTARFFLKAYKNINIMKNILVIIILLSCFNLIQAQEISDKVWVVFSEHTTQTTQGKAKLPEQTFASESIETEGTVTIKTNTAATFKTSKDGFISLQGHFKVEPGAYFKAFKGKLETTPEVDTNTETKEIQQDLQAIEIATPTETVNMKVFPNPFSDQVTIDLQLESDTNVRIALYDTNGRLVKAVIPVKPLEKGQHEVRVNTTDFVPGMYFCEVQTDSGQYRQAIVCTARGSR